jgi:EpsI family protein
MKSQSRFLITAALLIAATVYLHASARAVQHPGHRQLSEIPSNLGNWRGIDLMLTPTVIESAGMDDYANRRYSNGDGDWLDLYIGYYNSQRTGDVIHSPRNCLPGAGWEQVRTARLTIEVPSGQAITVNDFLIVKGLERQVVLYWYQGRGRAIASEYTSKLWMMSDAMFRWRSDGALVRIAFHVRGTEADARSRAVDFVRALYPQLKTFIPD